MELLYQNIKLKINSPKQLFLGINDIYRKGGEYSHLKEKHGLTPDKIVNQILRKLLVLMQNLPKNIKKFLLKALSIDNENDFKEDLKYNEIPEWDSIGHMTLMSGLEEAFKISMETDDIVDFSSYKKGKEILGKIQK